MVVGVASLARALDISSICLSSPRCKRCLRGCDSSSCPCRPSTMGIVWVGMPRQYSWYKHSWYDPRIDRVRTRPHGDRAMYKKSTKESHTNKVLRVRSEEEFEFEDEEQNMPMFPRKPRPTPGPESASLSSPSSLAKLSLLLPPLLSWFWPLLSPSNM